MDPAVLMNQTLTNSDNVVICRTFTLIQTWIITQTGLMNSIKYIRISLTAVMMRTPTWDMSQTRNMSQCEDMCQNEDASQFDK